MQSTSAAQAPEDVAEPGRPGAHHRQRRDDPRNQIEALDIETDPIELRQQIITSHHTLLPVYADTPGNIIGILHMKRVPALLQDATLDLEQLRETLYEPYFIPSDTPLLRQLQTSRSARRASGWW